MEKGIWVSDDNEANDCRIRYSTWLKEPNEKTLEFIQFNHSYDNVYLGGIVFFDLSKTRVEEAGNKGFLLSQFYPLGGNPYIDYPELVGKGLARRIELSVASDLAKKYPENTPVTIWASSDTHIKYCERVGIKTKEPMTLMEYVKILTH